MAIEQFICITRQWIFIAAGPSASTSVSTATNTRYRISHSFTRIILYIIEMSSPYNDDCFQVSDFESNDSFLTPHHLHHQISIDHDLLEEYLASKYVDADRHETWWNREQADWFEDFLLTAEGAKWCEDFCTNNGTGDNGVTKRDVECSGHGSRTDRAFKDLSIEGQISDQKSANNEDLSTNTSTTHLDTTNTDHINDLDHDIDLLIEDVDLINDDADIVNTDLFLDDNIVIEETDIMNTDFNTDIYPHTHQPAYTYTPSNNCDSDTDITDDTCIRSEEDERTQSVYFRSDDEEILDESCFRPRSINKCPFARCDDSSEEIIVDDNDEPRKDMSEFVITDNMIMMAADDGRCSSASSDNAIDQDMMLEFYKSSRPPQKMKEARLVDFRSIWKAEITPEPTSIQARMQKIMNYKETRRIRDNIVVRNSHYFIRH